MRRVNNRVIHVRRDNYLRAIMALNAYGVNFTPNDLIPPTNTPSPHFAGRCIGDMVMFRIHDPVDVISDLDISRIFAVYNFGRLANSNS